jgi:hypothetical protein
MEAMVKAYLMYDHIPPSLYCVIRVDTEGENYRVQVSEGEIVEVEARQPYTHRQSNGYSDYYFTRMEALEKAETLFRELELKGWYLSHPAIDP